MNECNKSFSELVKITAAEKFGSLSRTENQLQFALSTVFSAVPILAGAAGLVEAAAKEGSAFVWALVSGSASLSTELLANGVTPSGIAGNVAGTITETAITAGLTRVITQRLIAAGMVEAIPLVLPLLPEIAVGIVAIAVAAVIGFATSVFVDATAAYLNQPDQIFEITTAGPLDGTVTINGTTKPIQDGIREGVNVKNVRAGVADHHDGSPVRNSAISADLYGLSSGALYQIYAHCPDVLQLSSLSDTLDTAEVDLRDYDSWRFLDDEFKIDMAGGVDTVYYRTRPAPTSGNNGIFWYDGATHAAGGGLGGGQNILGITSTNAMLTLLVAESLLPDDDLIVKGAENIVLTGENDRFVFTGQDMSIHSGYGKISGGGGGDIIVFNGAKAGPGGLGLEIDGGTGNDWLYASGTGAVVYGGTGRDYIVNRSKGGVIYGDTVDGLGGGDIKANADKIEMSMGVTLMDAGIWDQVVFHGIRLTGGVYGGRPAGKNTVYDDKLMSGIAYKQVGSDVWVYNRYADIGNLNGGGASGGANKDNVFVIKNLNIAAASSGWGLDQLGISNETKLGLSFKTRNPWTEDVLKLMSYSSLVPIVGGLAAALGALGTLVIMLDELLNRVTAVALAAKSLRWAAGTDPLVIDLDGDGIETTGLGSAVRRMAANDNECSIWARRAYCTRLTA